LALLWDQVYVLHIYNLLLSARPPKLIALAAWRGSNGIISDWGATGRETESRQGIRW
jgi:hypothetical protein